ncbi:MAG: hypothetical protein WC705_01510 [Candidatus Paceibacterota bacterium]|jgi:hypothetical protein
MIFGVRPEGNYSDKNPEELESPTIYRDALKRKEKLTPELGKRIADLAMDKIAGGNDDYKKILAAISKLHSGEELTGEERELIHGLISEKAEN